MAIHVRPRLVRGAALHGFRGLSELQIDAGAESAAGRDVRGTFDNQVRLLDAEDIRTRVVGAQQVDAIVRLVAVELVEPFEARSEQDVLERVRLGRGRLRRCRLGRGLRARRGRRGEAYRE